MPDNSPKCQRFNVCYETGQLMCLRHALNVGLDLQHPVVENLPRGPSAGASRGISGHRPRESRALGMARLGTARSFATTKPMKRGRWGPG